MILSFGVRLSLELLSTKTIESLIAHSLAYCSFVSQDRRTIKCTFLSEPVVAEVAKDFFKKKGSDLQPFQTLKQHFLTNHLNIGDIGETVTQIICLKAFDSLVDNQKIYFNNFANNPVFLKDFLLYFWPEAAFDNFPQQYCLFFNHFIELEEQITLAILTKGLRRCCAFKLKKNCKGADLAIPLFDIAEGFGAKVSGILWIQIKTKEVDTLKKIEKSLGTKLCSNYILGNQKAKTSEQSNDIRKLPSFGIHFNLVAKVVRPLYYSSEKNVFQSIISFMQVRGTKEIKINTLNDASWDALSHICSKLRIKENKKRDLMIEAIEKSIKNPTWVNLENHKMFSNTSYNCCCFLTAATNLKKLFTAEEWQALLDILSVRKQTSMKDTTFDREACVKSYHELHKEEVMRLKQINLD